MKLNELQQLSNLSINSPPPSQATGPGLQPAAGGLPAPQLPAAPQPPQQQHSPAPSSAPSSQGQPSPAAPGTPQRRPPMSIGTPPPQVYHVYDPGCCRAGTIFNDNFVHGVVCSFSKQSLKEPKNSATLST